MKLFFILFLFSFSAFSEVCELKNARVRRVEKDGQNTLYLVGNLDRMAFISVSPEDKNSTFAKMLKASEKDTQLYLNFNVPALFCDYLKQRNSGIVMDMAYVYSPTIGSFDKTDDIDCIEFSNAPLGLALPSMKDMKKILDKSAGFSSDKVDQTARMLVHLFDRMNMDTKGANVAVFLVSLFKAFDLLGVQNINKEQLAYLTQAFKSQLAPQQYKLLVKIMGQVDSLAFKREGDGVVKVSLNSVGGKDIVIKGEDLPAMSKADKERMEKYFNRVEITNGTSMKFVESKASITPLKLKRDNGLTPFEVKSISKPTKVDVEGIKVFGQFPVIGSVKITPSKLDVDIDKSTPVKANVGFKKGFLGMSYTFDMNY